MPGFDAPEPCRRLRDFQGVEVPMLEIQDRAAPGADEMVVDVRVGVESNPGVKRPDGRDQPEVCEQPQGSIDGIQRNRGHFFADAREDSLDVRMVAGPGHLSEDLDALLGELDAGAADYVLEPIYHPPQLISIALHFGMPLNNKIFLNRNIHALIPGVKRNDGNFTGSLDLNLSGGIASGMAEWGHRFSASLSDGFFRASYFWWH